jgi:hypothetical protein
LDHLWERYPTDGVPQPMMATADAGAST